MSRKMPGTCNTEQFSRLYQLSCSTTRLYAESAVCAPRFGPELGLAFGNRSAALYHMGKFRACLRDIELALQYR